MIFFIERSILTSLNENAAWLKRNETFPFERQPFGIGSLAGMIDLRMAAFTTFTVLKSCAVASVLIQNRQILSTYFMLAAIDFLKNSAAKIKAT